MPRAARSGSASAGTRPPWRGSTCAHGAIERVEIGARSPGWFAHGTRDLWIQADDNLLVHVDPATRKVVGSERIGRTLAQPAAAADGTIWVPDKELDVVFRIDPATGKAIDSFPGGDGAFAALNAFGSMWVTSYAGATYGAGALRELVLGA